MKKHLSTPPPVAAETEDLLICRLSVVYHGLPYYYLVLDKNSKDGQFHSDIEKTFLLVSGYVGKSAPYAYRGLLTYNGSLTTAGDRSNNAGIVSVAAAAEQMEASVRKNLAAAQAYHLKICKPPKWAFSLKGRQLQRITAAAAGVMKSRL